MDALDSEEYLATIPCHQQRNGLAWKETRKGKERKAKRAQEMKANLEQMEKKDYKLVKMTGTGAEHHQEGVLPGRQVRNSKRSSLERGGHPRECRARHPACGDFLCPR